MARRKYRMTPKRKQALRKAQAASARKRRRGRNTALKVAGGVTVVAITAGAAAGVRRRSISTHQRKVAAVRETGSRYRGGPTMSWHRGLDVIRISDRRMPNVGMPLRQARKGVFGADTAKRIAKFDEAAKHEAKWVRQKRQTKHNRAMKKIRVAGRMQLGKFLPNKIPKRNRFTRAQARRRKK